MPLDQTEIVDLADEAAELRAEIAQALKRDSDGKIRLSRAERKRIARAALKLLLVLGRDLLD